MYQRTSESFSLGRHLISLLKKIYQKLDYYNFVSYHILIEKWRRKNINISFRYIKAAILFYYFQNCKYIYTNVYIQNNGVLTCPVLSSIILWPNTHVKTQLISTKSI